MIKKSGWNEKVFIFIQNKNEMNEISCCLQTYILFEIWSKCFSLQMKNTFGVSTAAFENHLTVLSDCFSFEIVITHATQFKIKSFACERLAETITQFCYKQSISTVNFEQPFSIIPSSICIAI